jgi:branched-subunit amino acid aminotransferase/4-amino-4-deoxychorismate lyase
VLSAPRADPDEQREGGAAAEIVPITDISGIPIGDAKPGRITKRLTEDFAAYRSAV